MPAGNWDFYQHLNTSTYRVEWPTGPLRVDAPSEIATWLEAWVVQQTDVAGRTDASQGTRQIVGGSIGASQRIKQTVFPVPVRWTADGGWIQGRLNAGPALGISLVYSHDSATNTEGFFWWLDVIDLS